MSMNWVSTSSDNGLSPVRRLAVTWTNTDMFSIGLWKTNFSEIWIKMLNLSFMKMILKILSAKWRPFCPGERLENVKAASPAGPNASLRHQMETFFATGFCAGNSPVTREFPSQRPVTRSFDLFFGLRLNQQLNKQLRRRWFETPSRSLWRHCNEISPLWSNNAIWRHGSWSTMAP